MNFVCVNNDAEFRVFSFPSFFGALIWLKCSREQNSALLRWLSQLDGPCTFIMRKSRVPRVLISVIILFAFARAHLTFLGAWQLCSFERFTKFFRHKKRNKQKKSAHAQLQFVCFFRCWLRIITSSRKKKKERNKFFSQVEEHFIDTKGEREIWRGFSTFSSLFRTLVCISHCEFFFYFFVRGP